MKTKWKAAIIAVIASLSITLIAIGATPQMNGMDQSQYQFEVIRINSDDYLIFRMNTNSGKLEAGWVDVEHEADELEWVKGWTEFKKVD